MRKKILYDKKYLTEKLNYSKVPVRQILALDLKPLTQLLLIQLFSHSDNWGVSFNHISKSFYHTKNRNDIKKHFDDMISKGYLKEGNDSYYISLTQIQKDYETFLKKGDKTTNSVNRTTIDSTPTSQDVSPATSGLIEPLSGDDDSNPNNNPDSYANTNNIKNNNKEKEETIKSINNDFDISLQSIQNICNPKQDSYNNQTPITTDESFSHNPDEGIIQSDSRIPSQAIPTYHFSTIEIEEQINEYLKSESKFFKGDNQVIVSNTYIEYYNEYSNTKLTISKYEQVLFVQLLNATMSPDVFTLNEHLSNTPITFNPVSTHDFLKMVNDNKENQEIFKKIIEEVNQTSNDNNRV